MSTSTFGKADGRLGPDETPSSSSLSSPASSHDGDVGLPPFPEKLQQ